MSGAVLILLTELKQELKQLGEKIDLADKSMEKIARENETCRRLVAMPGVGPVTATAIIATIGNGAAFGKGRDFAAWLGVVHAEHWTGGKQTLWKIPQRGNQYLRRLFVQGARAVMQHRNKRSSGLIAWLAQLTARTHHNVAIVALANKLARMAWAVLARSEVYRPLDTIRHYRLTGLQMAPGRTPGLEIASAISTSASRRRRRSSNFPARSAGEERDGTTV